MNNCLIFANAEKKLQEEDLSLKRQRATYEALKKKFETE
jgi:hypothetical protein